MLEHWRTLHLIVSVHLTDVVRHPEQSLTRRIRNSPLCQIASRRVDIRPGDAWRAQSREELGDPEGEVEGLAGVEAGVAHRLVAVVEVGVEDLLGAAEALGDVVAGELDVDAARPGALGPVGGEEAGDLGQDVVEVAGLLAAGAVKVLPCIGSQAHTTGWPASRTAAQQRRQARPRPGRRPCG